MTPRLVSSSSSLSRASSSRWARVSSSAVSSCSFCAASSSSGVRGADAARSSRTAANRSGGERGRGDRDPAGHADPGAVRPVVDGPSRRPAARSAARSDLPLCRRRRRRRRAGAVTPPTNENSAPAPAVRSRSDSRYRPTSLSAVASRIWSWRSSPSAAATSRPRWRTTKTSDSRAQHQVQQRRGHRHRLPYDQHAGVVAAHPGVAQQRRRDHQQRPALQPGIVVEPPAVGHPVGVHDETGAGRPAGTSNSRTVRRWCPAMPGSETSPAALDTVARWTPRCCRGRRTAPRCRRRVELGDRERGAAGVPDRRVEVLDDRCRRPRPVRGGRRARRLPSRPRRAVRGRARRRPCTWRRPSTVRTAYPSPQTSSPVMGRRDARGPGRRGRPRPARPGPPAPCPVPAAE